MRDVDVIEIDYSRCEESWGIASDFLVIKV